MVRVRVARLEDVAAAYAKLRPEDINECQALLGMSGRAALEMMFAASSESLVAEAEGSLVCIFGVVEPDCLWLLFSNEVRWLPLSFFRKSKVVLDGLLSRYGRLGNYTAAENSFVIRWLEWLGFTVGPPEVFRGALVRRFYGERREADVCGGFRGG